MIEINIVDTVIQNRKKIRNISKVERYRFNQNKPSTYVCTEQIFDSQPTIHTQQNNFEKNRTEVCCQYLYASFGTFCVQISQLFVALDRIPKSTTFSLDSSDLSIFKHTSKTHWD